jgi:hypothetical protein
MFEKMLGIDPKQIEDITRKISRRLLAANAPESPAWYFDMLLKEGGLNKSDSSFLALSVVREKVEQECAFAWPWYWADEVLKRENAK